MRIYVDYRDPRVLSHLDSMATQEPEEEGEIEFDDEDSMLEARERARERRIERDNERW